MSKRLVESIWALLFAKPNGADLVARVLEASSPEPARVTPLVVGPVACAVDDCWRIVDDAPIGSTVLCESCKADVMERR